jgi:trigger factor
VQTDFTDERFSIHILKKREINVSDLSIKPQLSNGSVSILYSLRPGCVVDMTVHMTPNTCKMAAKAAVKNLRKEISLPGFRKGHVPEDLIAQHFGPDLKRQMERELAVLALNEGPALLQKRPFSQMGIRNLSLRKYSKETGAEVHLEYETDPSVPPVAYEDLKLEKITPKIIDEKEISDFIVKLRYMFAKQTPITDRETQLSDRIEFETIRLPEGESLKDSLFCHQGLMPDWLLSNIVGMKIGDEKEIAIPSQKTPEIFKQCRIKILGIQACQVPEESDEEFLKAIGIQSVEELYKIAHDRLAFEAGMEAFAKMRKQLRNELIRLYAFDLPQTLVEQETEARFKDYIKNHEKDISDKNALRKTIMDEVKRHLTCALLLEPLFPFVKNRLKPSDTQRELWHQLHEVSPVQCVLHSSLKEKQMIDRLWSNVICNHVEDWLIEKSLGILSPKAQTEKQKEVVGDPSVV